MSRLRLCVVSLRYSSWSMRLGKQDLPAVDDTTSDEASAAELRTRRIRGSVTGLFPVLYVDKTPVHESLAICEWVNEAYPAASLWPEDPITRARARAIASEMAANFSNLRTHMSSHLFGPCALSHLRNHNSGGFDRICACPRCADRCARSGAGREDGTAYSRIRRLPKVPGRGPGGGSPARSVRLLATNVTLNLA
jgi:hypothetical protein